jgi:hypothetical protein
MFASFDPSSSFYCLEFEAITDSSLSLILVEAL